MTDLTSIKGRNTYRSEQIAEYQHHCGKEARVKWPPNF